jgi:hypothetical protein
MKNSVFDFVPKSRPEIFQANCPRFAQGVKIISSDDGIGFCCKVEYEHQQFHMPPNHSIQIPQRKPVATIVVGFIAMFSSSQLAGCRK